MAKWLKNGKSEKEIIEADAEVKKTVEKILQDVAIRGDDAVSCLLYTSPSPRDYAASRMPSSA